jgi:hypothetical protein
MNIVRLFHVLVVGGALLGGSSCEGGDDDGPAPDAPTGGAPDSAPADPDATPGAPDASLVDAPPGLIDCFCNTDHDTCCTGTMVNDGFQCCWSTTC